MTKARAEHDAVGFEHGLCTSCSSGTFQPLDDTTRVPHTVIACGKGEELTRLRLRCVMVFVPCESGQFQPRRNHNLCIAYSVRLAMRARN